MTAVAEPAAGQSADGRSAACMAGIGTLRPCTTCTGTGRPADDAGARPQPLTSSSAPTSNEATSDSVDATARASTSRRRLGAA